MKSKTQTEKPQMKSAQAVFGKSRDAYTMRHLDAWLDSEVNGDTCREEVRTAMLSLYDDDPEYWDSQSWWNLFYRTQCDRILEKYM